MKNIIYKDEDQIACYNRRFSEQFRDFNSIAEIFNTTHDGIGVVWSQSYARLLLARGFNAFRTRIETDCQDYINKAPAFLRTNIKQYYSNLAESTYHNIDRIITRVINKFSDFLSELNLSGDISQYIDICKDGFLSRSKELDQAIEKRFTISSDDEQSEVVQALKYFIEAEQKVKELMGGNYQGLLSTQQTNISHFDHEFKLIPLVDCLKKNGLL